MITFSLLLALADTGRSRIVAPPWTEARLSLSQETFVKRLGAWQWHSLTVSRRAKAFSYSLGAYASRRFGLWDAGAAADLTRTLWGRAYGNLRVAVAPNADVIARTDISGELSQALPHGWEIAPSARLMRFKNNSVPIYGFALGKYYGDFYGRARVAIAAPKQKSGTSYSALLRRYFGNGTDLLEVSGGTGQEVETVSSSVPPIVRNASFLAARSERMLTRSIGASVAFNRNWDELLPARTGFALGFFVRR